MRTNSYRNVYRTIRLIWKYTTDDRTKVESLYLEVRYARDTSLSLPKTSDLFRLMKDHRKLPVKSYAVNLKMYLSNIISNACVTLEDFTEAMDIILDQ